MVNKVELLAPAGNMECLKAAVHAGADAIYLAGTSFGARAYADNFSTEELCDALDYCHLFGVKVYLTLNTLVKEREFSQIGEYILPFYEHGLDGVIIQDFGVLKYLHDQFPGMELHASTQMTITGSYATKLLKEYGVSRIVPARELSIEELVTIKKETGIDMEVFVHGAMCYGYSGQCLFSSVLGGRSGNRGRCAGPCRLPYDVYRGGELLSGKKGESYPLSLKDLCTVELIGELICAGMDSFKIEGRMKSAVYVAGVTAIYRKYIDQFYALAAKYNSKEKAREHFCVEAADLEQLRNLYVRTDLEQGYFHKHNGASLVTISKPSYQTGAEESNLQIKRNYLDTEKKLPISIWGSFYAGQASTLSMTYGDHSVYVTGAMVSKAENRPMSAEDIEKQLKKLGATNFSCDEVFVETDGAAFIANKELNELRREASQALTRELLEPYFRKGRNQLLEAADSHLIADKSIKKTMTTVSVKTLDQLELATKQDWVERIFLDMDLCCAHKGREAFCQCLLSCKEKQISICLLLPRVIRQNSYKRMQETVAFAKEQEFDGVVTSSLEGFAYAKECGVSVIADAGLYSFNRMAAKWLTEMGASELTVPIECNQHEQIECVGEEIKASLISYGYIPLMESAGCVAKTMNACRKDNSICKLRDRMGKEFTVQLHCDRCENTIYNCVPMFIQECMSDTASRYGTRIDLTIETKEETQAVLDCFGHILNGEKCELPCKEYTKGYYKRGVE